MKAGRSYAESLRQGLKVSYHTRIKQAMDLLGIAAGKVDIKVDAVDNEIIVAVSMEEEVHLMQPFRWVTRGISEVTKHPSRR